MSTDDLTDLAREQISAPLLLCHVIVLVCFHFASRACFQSAVAHGDKERCFLSGVEGIKTSASAAVAAGCYWLA